MGWLAWVGAGLMAGVAGLALRTWLRTGWYHLPTETGPVPPMRTLPVVLGVSVAGVVRHLGDVDAWRALPAYLVAVVIGTLLAYADLDVHRLPEPLVHPGFGAATLLLACAGRWSAWPVAVACAVAVLVVFLLAALAAPGGIGLGDVTLLGWTTLLLGWWGPVVALGGLIWGFLIGGLWALALVVTRRAALASHFAYGPALLLGALLSLLAAPAP
ncbi:prepilin peptidase [Calidifontibacter sp. DB0510]|uniref:Prepilin peptidase n=1 Tax=Metallococcus carri TaxID=1656884 RepID=A0A967AYS9_9MICO|nr:prepilin peptidase [Metallococcus carri]NHN55551.1 prepilin peptidase [Metallococcus carri]NOP38265.1 prepilin peptidase [Calidifontibacter sp. DB2511S]